MLMLEVSGGSFACVFHGRTGSLGACLTVPGVPGLRSPSSLFRGWVGEEGSSPLSCLGSGISVTQLAGFGKDTAGAPLGS